jgi:hypothetical protein
MFEASTGAGTSILETAAVAEPGGLDHLMRARARCRRDVLRASDGGSGVAGAADSGDDPLPYGFGPSMALLERSVRAMVCCGLPADGGSLVAVRAQVDQLLALVCEAEVRFDVNELWRDDGAGSLRGWLADRGGLGRKAASAEAKRVERLESWPEVRDAWVSGALSGPQIDVLVAAVPNRFVSLFARHAEGVVHAIAPLDVEQTAIAMRQWLSAAESDDGADDFRERPSGLHLDRTFDGSFLLQGQLNATEASIIDATLRVFDVPDPVDENGEVIGERRTSGQRQADALVAACSFALAHRDGGGESGRFQPHVSLVIDVQELRSAALRGAGVSSVADVELMAEKNRWSAAEKAWFTEALSHHGDAVTTEGMVIDALAMSTLSCDSVLQAVVTNGSKVLRLGRLERTARPWQRRAIIARDRHCRAPGCRMKPRFCDVHHVDHWANGGKTDVDRMVLLCGTHHREFHKPGYEMELAEDGLFTVHSPKGWTRSSVPEHFEALVFARKVRGGPLAIDGPTRWCATGHNSTVEMSGQVPRTEATA